MDRGHNNPPEVLPMLRQELVEASSEQDDDARLYGLIQDIMETIESVTTDDPTSTDLKTRTGKIIEVGNRWQRERPEIKNNDEHDKGTAFVSAAAQLETDIENARNARGKPLFNTKKKIDATFNGLKNKVALAKGDVQQKLNRYAAKLKAEADAKAAEEKRKADEAMRAAQEEARKAQEANDEAAKQKAQNAVMEAQRQENAAKTAHKVGGKTDQGASYHTRTVDVIAIDDKKKIPLKLWQDYSDEDMTMKIIRAARRDGITDIPGVTVTQETRQVTKS